MRQTATAVPEHAAAVALTDGHPAPLRFAFVLLAMSAHGEPPMLPVPFLLPLPVTFGRYAARRAAVSAMASDVLVVTLCSGIC